MVEPKNPRSRSRFTVYSLRKKRINQHWPTLSDTILERTMVFHGVDSNTGRSGSKKGHEWRRLPRRDVTGCRVQTSASGSFVDSVMTVAINGPATSFLVSGTNVSHELHEPVLVFSKFRPRVFQAILLFSNAFNTTVVSENRRSKVATILQIVHETRTLVYQFLNIVTLGNTKQQTRRQIIEYFLHRLSKTFSSIENRPLVDSSLVIGIGNRYP